MPEIRRRAASWYRRNDLPQEALEYSIAAGDVDAAARLVERLWVPAYRQGRATTVQRWLGWLDDQGGIAGQPVVAVWASALASQTGRPVEAERQADVVDRWVHGDRAQPVDPPLVAMARGEWDRAEDLAGQAGIRVSRAGINDVLVCAALRARLAPERGSSIPGASALTAAELRLPPLLPTHLSVPEIAAELVLSPHTIKSPMKSIYRKLDVTTRHQAVTRAREWGLLEG